MLVFILKLWKKIKMRLRKILLLFIGLIGGFIAVAVPEPIGIRAKSYILIEPNSQMILTAKNATEPMAPASITKLMTAYVVYKTLQMRLLEMTDVVTISSKARNMTEGSRMFLERGSRVTIDQLLHGLVIQSGNDAAIALAEAVSGTEEAFIELMNQYAKQLGLTNSHFKNVTGLTEQGHYMSAEDIAKLSHAIITEFPEHYKLYSEKTYTWNKITQNNRNALLYSDETIDGLKTGYTAAAGYCLAASAKRDNMRLISVVLGTESKKARVRASRAILNFGFEHYKMKTFYEANQKIASASVDGGRPERVDVALKTAVKLPIANDLPTDVSAQLVLANRLIAPIAKGTEVGQVEIRQGERLLYTVPAVALSDIEELGFFRRLWQGLVSKISSWF